MFYDFILNFPTRARLVNFWQFYTRILIQFFAIEFPIFCYLIILFLKIPRIGLFNFKVIIMLKTHKTNKIPGILLIFIEGNARRLTFRFSFKSNGIKCNKNNSAQCMWQLTRDLPKILQKDYTTRNFWAAQCSCVCSLKWKCANCTRLILIKYSTLLYAECRN